MRPVSVPAMTIRQALQRCLALLVLFTATSGGWQPVLAHAPTPVSSDQTAPAPTRTNPPSVQPRVVSQTTLQFSAPTYQVGEGDGQAVITVTRSGSSAGTVSANIVLTDVTTTAGSDYTIPNGPGTLDTSFGNPNASFVAGSGSNGVYGLAVQPADGKIIYGTAFRASFGGTVQNHIVRVNPDGLIDNSFTDPLPNASMVPVLLQPNDGKILVAGDFITISGQIRHRLARLNTNGTLDTSFADPNINTLVTGLALQSDGRVLAGWLAQPSSNSPSQTVIARFNSDGTVDPSFSGTAIAVSPGSYRQVNGIAIQPDGKILVGGQVSSGYNFNGYLLRLNSDGTPDPSFITPTFSNGSLAKLRVQSDGKILVVGYFGTVNGQNHRGIARFNSDGTLDSTFSDPGLNQDLTGLAIQLDGKLLVGGSSSSGLVTTRYLTRLNSNGTVDTSFADPGFNNEIFEIKIQPSDGKIVVGGLFTNTITGQPYKYLARVNGDLQVNWADGDTAPKTISIPITDDNIPEGNETLQLGLTNPGNGAVIGEPATTTLTIIDNDLAPTGLTLTVNPSPAFYGQPVTFTATVSPISASGSVTFSEGVNVLGTANLVGGVATLVTSSLSVGSHVITATYGGDASHTGSAAVYTLTINPAPVSVSLTANPNPSGYDQPVTFTASVSPIAASGVVTFQEGATVLGSGPLVNGVATYVTSTLSVGSHVITAVYSGDGNYTGGSAVVTQVVTAGPPTQLLIVGGNNQSAVINSPFGQPLVVQVRDAGNNPVTGEVVTFTAPAGAASASFAGGSNIYTATSDAGGYVTTTVLTANSQVGSYNVAVDTGTGLTPVNFSLTNTVGAAASLTAVSGAGQSAVVGSQFSQPLVARVVDGGNNPISGLSVTFTAPPNGASASFAGGSSLYTGTTDASGFVTSSVLTANGIPGNYTVTATVAGLSASFGLTNLAGCNPLLVTKATDDGSCGTLRQALMAATGNNGSKAVTITLAAGSVITLTTGLTLTAGVNLTTTASCGPNGTPPITLLGSGVNSGNGLTLAAHNSLYGLWVRGFSGVQLKAPAGSHTMLRCVKASKI